ncbi:MAG: phosphoglycolate phosphatase [Candidatus Nezhaarchaeota archaeon]|nr:phosphoglycolate phosphatase [Candidatus Nezhaarchaeota archaeon]
MRIEAAALDVDGTLTDESRRLAPRALEAVRKLEDAGIAVTLCTGNALCVAKTLASYLGCTGPVVCEGGGVVEYRGVVKVLAPRDAALRGMEALKAKFGPLIEESWTNKYRLVDAAFTSKLSLGVLSEALRGIEGVKLVYTGFAYHVVDASIDKGVGLREAASMLGIDLANVVAVGDSDVDEPMLKLAGLGVALGNAPGRLKEVADIVVEEPGGEGLANFIEWLLRKLGKA